MAGIVALAVLDTAAFYLSLSLAYSVRKFLNSIVATLVPLEFSLSYFFTFWWMPVIFLVFIAYQGLYVKRLSFWDEARELIKALTLAILVILAIVSLGRLIYGISRLTVVLLYFCSFLVFPLARLAGKKVLYRMNLWKENLIIIGAGRAGMDIAKGIDGEKHLGYNIIGFLDDDLKKIGRKVVINNRKYKVFGKIKNFKKFLSLLNISTVIIAIPSHSVGELSRLTNNVQKYTKRVLLIPDLKGIALANTELYHLFMQQLFLLKINNNLKSSFNQYVKRGVDLILSLLLLPFLLLLVGIFGLLILLDSRGPIFLMQERVGRDRKIFRCVKFRTMYMDSDTILEKYLKNNEEALEEWNRYRKLRDYDPRVTRIGKFLRRTSLDELPQIFNVFAGDMSFLGPRPYLPDEEGEMREYGDLILLTRPGITGLWQVSGRNELDFEARVKLDAWYVLNWSLWLDIVILCKTIRVVLSREGAY
ncbi:MAG: undecaprenyl-phosphate galactose phosphotransferase WbaP [Alphaproteobacteria bacterium]|uniref:Undecaprenyl-phosphate galactose phosphotransferase WbaP n=1 Tax=Candidatus Nitrobium versatile TaxID=2884831 RepID=A0A953SHE3_9BACT|nr:undecaprenyl-phosphate galactose phosphotransferase WbaP [Candidatus Nitrobium versatile]